MRRSVRALVGAALVTACTVGTVHADQLDGELPPKSVEETLVVDYCGFDVLVEVEGKHGEMTVGGHFQTFDPGLTDTLTNLDTGESVRVNAAGPGQVTVTPTADGFVAVLKATGNWMHGQPGQLLWTHGLWFERVVVEGGNIVERDKDLSRTHVVDMCEVLS